MAPEAELPGPGPPAIAEARVPVPLIRPAQPGDAVPLATMHIQAWRETFAGVLSDAYLQSLSVEDRVRMWHRALHATTQPVPERIHVVAVCGEDVVGFAATRPGGEGPRPLELWGIYLLRAWQGSGAGQNLLDAAIGDRPCFLWTGRANLRAHSFYRRNGFRSDGAQQVIPEWEGMEVFRMVR